MFGRRRKQRANGPIVGLGLLQTALLAVTVGLGNVTCSRPAFAQNAGDSAAAQALFEDGRALMATGDFSTACPKLEESQRLDPASGTLFHLADCYEHNGRIASAWTMFLEAAAAARATGNADRSRHSKQRAAALETRLSRIVIRLLGDKPAALEVRRDGAIVPPPQWGTAIPADPGAHTIAAAAPGRLNWQSTVVLREGVTETVLVPELLASTHREPAKRAAFVERTNVGDSNRIDGTGAAIGAQRVAALATGGIGVAAIAVGTVFGFQAMSLHDDSQVAGLCNGAACATQAGLDLQDRSNRAGNAATVAFALGAVGLATCGVLWFTAPQRGPSVGVGALQVRGTW
jgi:hypothetical protein